MSSLKEEYVEARHTEDNNNNNNKNIVPLTTCPVLIQPDGIVSFTHITVNLNNNMNNNIKNIILMGDYHENKPFVHNKLKGQFVLDWIIFTLFENPNLNIDLFLESDYKKENPPLPGHGPLFENVYRHLLFIKKIPNLHVHDVDIRLPTTKSTLFKSSIFKKIKQTIKIRFITPMLLAAFMCNVFKVTLRDVVPQKMGWKKMYHKLNLYKKVKTEIFLKNRVYYETSNALFCEQLEKSGTDKIYFLRCLYAASIHSTSYFMGVSLSSDDLYLFLNMSVMDAYCLASSLLPSSSTTGIIYAGESHVRVYRSFFKRFYKNKVLEKQHAFDFLNRRPQLNEPIELTTFLF